MTAFSSYEVCLTSAVQGELTVFYLENCKAALYIG